MTNEHSIKALINLIDDPDFQIYEQVRDQIISIGKEVIPILEDSWETQDYGLLFQNRIEELIHEIQFNTVQEELRDWVNSTDKDLLKGAIIVAKYQYSSLDSEKIIHTIESMRKDIWLELREDLTSFEKIKIFNKIFFEVYGFHGDSKHFHSPMNSFINTVIESRKGNPLSLSLIYSYVAQQLEIPVYGVNLPNHFIMAFLDEENTNFLINNSNDYGVLFYINPFSKGSLLDVKSIKEFLIGLNLPIEKRYFEPCSNTAIIQRMVTNLIASFQKVGALEKVEELTLLRSILD